MKRLIVRLLNNCRGASAMEAALALPVLILFIVGLLQLGILFSANAGLKEAVDEGARYATIYPSPSDSDIIMWVNKKKFSLNPAYVTGPTVARGTSNGVSYVDVSMRYAVPLNFVFFTVPSVTLRETRRAYQP